MINEKGVYMYMYMGGKIVFENESMASFFISRCAGRSLMLMYLKLYFMSSYLHKTIS